MDSSSPSPAANQPPPSMSLQPQRQPVSSPPSHTGTATAASDIRSVQAALPKSTATSQTRPIVYQSQRRFCSALASPRETVAGLDHTPKDTHGSGAEELHDISAPSPRNPLELRDPQILAIAQARNRSLSVSPMNCVTWNVQGLHNPYRQAVVGRYRREWGADVICLQETPLANPDQQTWSSLGWGRDATLVHINATGELSGVLLAWKEIVFAL